MLVVLFPLARKLPLEIVKLFIAGFLGRLAAVVLIVVIPEPGAKRLRDLIQ